MEQSEERLSRINAYNKLVDAAILTKISSKSVADIVNHELGIECNASNVQEILKSSVSASDMHKIRREIEGNASIKMENANGTSFLRKYVSFSGCISRSEYWALKLLILPIVAIILLYGVAMVWDKTGNDSGILVLFVIIFISYIYFNIVADFRRLHDIGESGWLVLLKLVPLANIVIAAFLFFKGSQSAGNQHKDLKSSH